MQEPPSIHGTLGVLFLSNILVAVLFAITSVQVYIYFHRCTEDNKWMQRVVFFLWLLDALHFALTTHAVYYYAISNYMNPSALGKEIFSLTGCMIVAGVNDLTVTIILACRIYRFNREKNLVKVVVTTIAVASICVMAGDIAVPILALRGSREYSDFAHKYSWAWYMSFGTRAGVDILIAISIFAMLYPYRSGFRKTSSAIRLAIIYTINTCALTTVFAILSVALFAAVPNTFAAFFPAMQLPKLMLNSLLAVLNSRQRMREIILAYDSEEIRTSRITHLVFLHTISSSTRSGCQFLGKLSRNHQEDTRPPLSQRREEV